MVRGVGGEGSEGKGWGALCDIGSFETSCQMIFSLGQCQGVVLLMIYLGEIWLICKLSSKL